MENKDVLQDEFLQKLIGKSKPDNPSDDFLARVMTRVGTLPVYEPEKKPFFFYLKSFLPWGLLALLFGIIFYFSDFNFTGFLPGKSYIQEVFMPSIGSFFAYFESLFSGKFGSITLAVLLSGGFLFGIERLLRMKIS